MEGDPGEVLKKTLPRAQAGGDLVRTSTMASEFTAIIEGDSDWYFAYCAEIPGANGQGRTKREAVDSVAEAIKLILEDRRDDAIRGPIE